MANSRVRRRASGKKGVGADVGAGVGKGFGAGVGCVGARVGFVCLFLWGAIWAGPADGQSVVLHERLPPAPDGPALPLDRSAPVSRDRTRVPGALPAPFAAAERGAQYGPAVAPRVGLDRRTGADLDLHYQVVFDPSVAPFKRDWVFDRVRADITLEQSGAGLAQQSKQGQVRPGHELFWGHARMRLVPGERSPLPSVAPTSQVIELHSVPDLELRLWRDAAGNFSLEALSDQPVEVEIRFLMDAPWAYFGAPVGLGHATRDQPTTPRLESDLLRRARALWPALGLSSGAPAGANLMRLTEWFRGFSPGEPPPRGNDALADLVLGQVGVCRHRSLGFVVMAHSLGMAAHYVMNDAHAFVEAWVPDLDGRGRWQRIDLGGGADSLELHTGRKQHLHQPQASDPFPQPPAYADQQGQVRVDGQPVAQSFAGARRVAGTQWLEGVDRAGAAGAPGDVAAVGAKSAAGSPAGLGDPHSAVARRAWLAQRAQRLAARSRPPQAGDRVGAPQDRRRPTQTTVQAEPMAWIGETLRASGSVLDDGGAVVRASVELWLVDPRQPSQGWLLGVAVTDGRGRYQAEFEVPSDLGPESFDLVARFVGDARRRPSDSRPR